MGSFHYWELSIWPKVWHKTVNYVTHHEWHSGNDQPHMRVIKLAKHDVALRQTVCSLLTSAVYKQSGRNII